jgi:methyl-accepting chemotaxis protein
MKCSSSKRSGFISAFRNPKSEFFYGRMKMFKNMKLRYRILLGYIVPLALFIGVTINVFIIAHEVSLNSELVQKTRDIIDHDRSAELAVISLVRSTRGYLLTQESKHSQHVEEDEKEITEVMAYLKRIVIDPEQQATLDQIDAKEKIIVATEREAVSLVDEKKVAAAIKLFMYGEKYKTWDELKALFEKFNTKETEILGMRLKQQEDALSRLLTTVWVGALLATLASIIIGLWITGRISSSIKEQISALSASSTEIAATMTEHERTVGEQSAAVTEVSATAEELGVSAQTSSQQSEKTASLANQSLALTEEGIKLANRSYDGITQMKARVGAVAEQILRLSEQAEQIGSIAKVVGELASETNMLALNAAVEAARAGEHGKGFAVVATEIRKLADQSKKSAERTNALVAEVQKATNSAVMATEEGTKTAEEVAAIARQSGESFASLAEVSSKVYEGAQQLMLNSKQQSSALTQVSEAMKNLSNGSKEIAAGTAQAKIGVVKLNEVAQSLKALV